MSTEQTSAILRVTGVVAALVLAQLAIVAQFRIFGVVPDLVPLLVVCVGLLGGSTSGAVTGFTAGFLVDLMLLQTMGVSSLILTFEGYAAGRLRELRDPVHPLTTPAVGALAATVFSFGFGVMQFSLGQPAPRPLSLLWQVMLSALYGAVLATPVFRTARWAIMPALGGGRDDPLFRRRRASLARTRVLHEPTIQPRRRRGRPGGRNR